MNLPINDSDDLRIGGDGATSAWMNGVQVWPPDTVTCPTLAYTSGNSVNGLGTWDGGTKISLKQTNNFMTTYDFPSMTFLYSRSYGAAIGTISNRRPNMAVDDAGFAYLWNIATGTGGNYALFKYNIAANTATKIYQSSSGSHSRFQGPAWNPYDGLLYEIEDLGTGSYELASYTTSGTRTLVHTFVRSFTFQQVDMVTFTADGAIWLDMDASGGSGAVETIRFDGSETAIPVTTGFQTCQVPRTSSTVWSSHDSGLVINAAGSTSATDCPLFATSGTARVHSGLSGLTTFIYPTSSGVGTAIYTHTV